MTETKGVNGEMWSLTVEFGAFMLTLALGAPGGTSFFHPSALVVLKEEAEAAQQTLLIGWPPGLGGDPVITTRVDQMDGWDPNR